VGADDAVAGEFVRVFFIAEMRKFMVKSQYKDFWITPMTFQEIKEFATTIIREEFTAAGISIKRIIQ
jgi:hypothetical protein